MSGDLWRCREIWKCLVKYNQEIWDLEIWVMKVWRSREIQISGDVWTVEMSGDLGSGDPRAGNLKICRCGESPDI